MSPPHLVHGTGTELVPADWPPLTLEELRGIGLPATAVLWHSPRPLSSAALVEVGGQAVFVKRHSARVRGLPALSEEHAFAAHLHAAGVPVPQVLGAYRAGAWTYEVHARGVGDDTYRDVPSWQPLRTTAHARAAGAALARLSLAAASFPAPRRGPWLLVAGWHAVSEGLDPYLRARPLVARALAGRDPDVVLAPWRARLAPYVEDLPPGWTHGDGHASNLLWTGDEVTAVLDLGLAERTTPLFDLATAVERNAVSWLSPRPAADLRLVDALLAGWSGVRPLSPLERAALPELLPLVHVDFALSELAYFAEVLGNRGNADLAYDGYLLGHARWFGTDQGRRLLGHLRRVLTA